jgi:hypothetical protein
MFYCNYFLEMHYMWFMGVLIFMLLILWVYKLGIKLFQDVFNFLECHCIMLQQPICGTTISCVFSQNVGCL